MNIANALLDRLRAIVGTEGFLDRADDMAPYASDHRKLYRGATPIVLRPATTQQVAELLALCYAENIAVVPSGGNTGYCGGATPSADG
ncbi:MAG: FAD-binding oxidoreductase, partial [Candidatus Obscuribacterales bacterium]|nr:FAD-binding oxidoreductase [Steroidobacteraceae bacterium]